MQSPKQGALYNKISLTLSLELDHMNSKGSFQIILWVSYSVILTVIKCPEAGEKLWFWWYKFLKSFSGKSVTKKRWNARPSPVEEKTAKLKGDKNVNCIWKQKILYILPMNKSVGISNIIYVTHQDL